MKFPQAKDYPMLFNAGIILNVYMSILCFIAYSVYDTGRFNLFDDNGFFFLGYIPTLIYAISVVFGGKGAKKSGRTYPKTQLWFFATTAFSISAYILNLSMGLFQPFADWLSPLIIIMHIALFASAFREHLPLALRAALSFFIGISIWVSFAQFFHLVELLPLSLFVSWFFGISLHTFVPMIIIMMLIFDTVQWWSSDRVAKWSFLSGILLPAIVVGVFLFQWNSSKHIFHQAKATQITNSSNDLPEWVLVSQNWEDNWLNRKIMIGSLVYDDRVRGDGFGSMNGLDEAKRFDPLVSTALSLIGDIGLSRKDRIKILESRYDGRHNTHRKLWSGRDLETTDVLNEIQINPEQAHAYVEKTIIIKKTGNRWPRQQEALYTFQLPEGAFASSLSLWIEGKEERSRLTTKGKADSAYTTIVGRERRDPALLHWQEGNTLTVTVFPCSAAEDRKFKVGFTVPLSINEDKLVLKNISFKGPPSGDALETTIVRATEGTSLSTPKGFELIGPDEFMYTGNFRQKWRLEFERTPLTDLSFSFDSLNYSLHETSMIDKAHGIDKVFLDLNANWTDAQVAASLKFEEFAKLHFIAGKPVIVSGSTKPLIDRQRDKQFNLFPFHLLSDPSASLIITNSHVATPNVSDLKNSSFGEDLKRFMEAGSKPPLVLDLAESHSAYLQTLAQFKLIDLRHASIKDIRGYLESGTIPYPKLPENAVAIGNSGFHIAQSAVTGSEKEGANDQLMRLHHYNKILRDIGADYFTAENYSEGSLIDMANSAYVVSPISSLIVLESKKDYDRFDIEKNKNSLNNATVSSSGSIPEPHEWALIILALCIPLYHFVMRRSIG